LKLNALRSRASLLHDFVFLLVCFSFEHNEAVEHTYSLYDAKGDLTACGGYNQSITAGNSDGDQSVQ